MTSIYALLDPTRHQTIYVGKADDAERRFKRHIKEAKPGLGRKENWILALAARGFTPVLAILESPTDSWQEVEKRWIATFRAAGWDVLNATDGGDGASAGEMNVAKRPEARAKISKGWHATHDGRRAAQPLADWRRANPNFRRGVPRTAEERRKMSEGLRRRHPAKDNPTVECGCGCGALLLKRDAAGRPRTYLPWHARPASPIQDQLLSRMEVGVETKLADLAAAMGDTNQRTGGMLSRLKLRGLAVNPRPGIWVATTRRPTA